MQQSQVGLLTEDITRHESTNSPLEDDRKIYKIDSNTNQWSFLAFGVALLLPWNAIIAAMDYFIVIYPNHQPSYTFLVAVSVPMLLMQIVCFLLRGLIPLRIRLTFALFINATLTLLTAVIPQVITNETLSYYLMMIVVFIFGCMIAFLQTACYGVAGVSMKLTIQLMVGVGLSSILMNVLRMIFLAAVSSYEAGQIVFFSFSGAYMYFCCVLSVVFLKDYESHQKSVSADQINNSELKQGPYMSKDGMLYKAWQVYRINYPAGLSVVLTFAIQYTFFPGVMLTKELSFFHNFAWFANSIITFHNICDTVGRTLAGRYIIVSKKLYPYVCLIRLIFIITYTLFYTGVAPEFFQNDAFVLINLFFFSISCGYLASIGMYYGSDKEV